MYWIYLLLFVLVIFTPRFIQHGSSFLHEQDVESLLILFFGTLGLILYFAKEKALLRLIREKLHLQKQTNIITRDLSDSYSYIGEMNRKFDIVKELIFTLPKTTAEGLEKKQGTIYKPLLEAVSLLAKTDRVILGFADVKNKKWKNFYFKGASSIPSCCTDVQRLLTEGKFFWEEGDDVIIRSPRQAQGISAFLIFAKTRNHIEDGEMFKILVSEALLLYWVEQEGTSS